MLFIAYAEDRDLLPYRFNEAYRRRSLKQKAQELAECVASGIAIAAGSSHWQEASLLWQAVAAGNREWAVPAYDGGLFTDDASVSRAGALLAEITVDNSTFEAALRALLVIETAEGVPGPVDFRSLGVREFGTIYEGLLESELAVAEVDLALSKKGVYVPVHAVAWPLLLPLVKFISTTDPVYANPPVVTTRSTLRWSTFWTGRWNQRLQTISNGLRRWTRRMPQRRSLIFGWRTSPWAQGHFLIAAIDRIEKSMADRLASRDLPGVRRELVALREAATQELGELAETATIEDGQLLRRLIARRCIYGVDLNTLSVQLARLAVWIHTFVPGLPLSLLDRTLVQGNSLVGVGTVEDIRKRLADADVPTIEVDVEALLGNAERPLNRLANLNDATLRDIASGPRSDARSARGDQRYGIIVRHYRGRDPFPRTKKLLALLSRIGASLKKTD